MATIDGTNSNDRLFGGDENDTIEGGAGNDLLSGGAGDDVINGGDGGDDISGGAGSDTIDGGASQDILEGDSIVLDLDGIPSNNGGAIISSPFQSQASVDLLASAVDYGDTSVPQVTYTFTQNYVAHERVLYVNTNGDLVHLGSVTAGYSANFTAPEGAKFVFVNDDAPNDTINNASSKTPQYGIMGVTLESPDPGVTLQMGSFGYPNIYELFDGAADTIHGGDDNDIIRGQIGDDMLFGDAGNDRIGGDVGDDTISGGDGSDRLAGGAGNDTIYGNADGVDAAVDGDSDKIQGNAGNDTIYAQGGDDFVAGGDGDDTIDGGDGSDRLFGEGGTDTIEGGAGNDLIFGDGGPTFAPRSSTFDEQFNIFEPGIGDGLAGSLVPFSSRNDPSTSTTEVTFTNATGIKGTIYYVNPDGSVISDTMGLPAVSTRTYEIPDGGNVVLVNDATGEIVGFYPDITATPTISLTVNDNADQFVQPGAADIITGGDGNDTIMGQDGDDTIDGQAGVDSIFGGVGDDTITVGGGDVASGGADGDTFNIETGYFADGNIITIDGNEEGGINDYDVVNFGAGFKVVPHSYTVTATQEGVPTVDHQGNPASTVSRSGSIQLEDTATGEIYTVNFSNIEQIVCFTEGTNIETDHGEVEVQDLEVGDYVMTADRGYQPVRWIGKRRISAMELAANPKLLPIRIKAGALGNALPERDLIVSPQHRMLVDSSIAQRMFDTNQVLIAANKLVLIDGVEVAHDLEEVTYVHFLTDQHDVVYAEGAPSETLYTGPNALESLSPESLEEIFAIFPELANLNADTLPAPARPLIKNRKAKLMINRHIKNNEALLSNR